MDAPVNTVSPTPIPVPAVPAGAQIIGAENHVAKGPGPYVMDAKTLEGDAVVNAEGVNLGEITAIMVDVQRDRIAYAVLTFGGFLGMGTKLFAIPWSALTLDADLKRFILNVAKERLQTATGFDKDHWPSMADSTWASAVHAHYDIRPYWEDDQGTASDARTSSGTIDDSRMHVSSTGY